MSGGKIIVKQAYGINPLIRNCLAFTEDHFLAYSSGHQVIVINTESKEQHFIAGTSTYQHQSLGITAIQCCLNKKIIAIAEKVDPSAIITFYDSHSFKKKKLITSNELGSQEIRAIAFSDDGKFMIVQGCSPDWNLLLWNIEKAAKVICSVKVSLSDETPINQISFCPWDASVILVLGKNIFRMFRLQDGQLKPMPFIPRRESINCISHCWLPQDNLVIGTDTGDIMFVENFEYRGLILNQSGGNDTDWIHPVLAIAPYARGFLIGTNNGELRLFERNEELKERYSYENSCKLDPTKGNAITFAIGPDESLVCVTSNQQLLSISVTNALQSNKDNASSVISTSNNTSNWAENLLTQFHSPNPNGDASITGIDTALWKQSMVVTCGKDKTMRVWNTSDKRMELIKEFEDEPVSLSVHPSGLYVALAFSEKILILSILLDSIQVIREIHVRQCSFVKFSRGGQHLACATGTHLQLYNSFTGATTGTLRAHNNKIKSIIWLNCDARIVTIGSEGVVYTWDIFPIVKRPEQYSGTVPIAGGCGLIDGSKIYIATQDKLLREIDLNKTPLAVAAAMIPNAKASPTIAVGSTTSTSMVNDLPKNIDIGHNVGCMIYDDTKKMLLIGTVTDEQPGSILAVSVATHLGSLPIEVNTIHSGYITAMCQSYDGSFLYTGDSNGVFCINEFEHSSNLTTTTTKQQAREGMVSFEFIEEVMLQKSDLDARKKLIEDLTLKVEELHQNNLHQLRLKDLDHFDHKKEIEEKFTQQINVERIKFNELDSEKRAIENDFTVKVKKLESGNIDELRLIEFKYKTKQNQEENRYKQLQEETEESHKCWNDENRTLVESHQKYLQELTLEYEEKLLSEQHIQKSILVEKDSLKVTFNVAQQDTEIDGDHEVAEMKIRYDGKLRQEEENALTLMQQHAIMTKAHETLLKDSNQQKQEIKRLLDKETRLYESIHSLEKDILSHKKEIREREETITDKEKRIFDLKKKNQELEKFRFVLDYKIKELKLQIAPRENEIATMKTQISEMDLELDQYNKSNLALNLMIEELKLKLEGMKLEIKRQDERCLFNERLIERFKRDLQELWALKSDEALFKAKLIKIYRIYVQEELTPSTMSSSNNDSKGSSSNKKKMDMEDPQKVYNRDREQMERSLDSLRRSLKAEALAHKRDLGKMMRESVMLTKELNNLRKQSRVMILQKKAIEQAGELNPNADLTELMLILGVQVKRPPSPGKNNNEGNQPSQLPHSSGGGGGNNTTLPPVPPTITPPTSATMSKQRTTALKSINADGKLVYMNNNSSATSVLNTKKMLNNTNVSNNGNNNNVISNNISNTGLSRQDQWEAWREIQIQYDTMKGLEDQVIAICNSLSIDPIPIIVGIDTTLL